MSETDRRRGRVKWVAYDSNESGSVDGNALNNLTVTDVRVVNIGDVLKGNNVEAFNNALNRNNVAIDVLSGGVTLFVQPVPAP